MKINELFKGLFEDAPPSPSNTSPANADDQNDNNVGKLTATVGSLQKQVQDLQKSAIQQAATSGQSTPGITPNQPQVAKGTVGGTASTVDTQRDDNVLDTMKKLAGVTDPTVQPKQQTPVAGTGQSPQVTNMRIKQQLSQNQGIGTP